MNTRTPERDPLDSDTPCVADTPVPPEPASGRQLHQAINQRIARLQRSQRPLRIAYLWQYLLTWLRRG